MRTSAPLAPNAAPERTLLRLALYFGKLGAWGFGGPIALCGYMHRDLVAGRRWYSEDQYRQGLAIAQTMPGPLAAQLAMWLGYLERGALGALVVTLPFVVPSFLLATALAVIYAEYQGLDLMAGLLFGIGPAVISIVAIAAWRLAGATNGRDPVLWTVAAVVATTTALSGAEIVWVFLAACLFGTVYYGGGLPRSRGAFSFLPLLAVSGFSWSAPAPLLALAFFFVEASAFTFGSGLAIVPFLHDGLVTSRGWLSERQFTDAVAVGLITPGPVVIMATFAGYLIAGVVGAVIATVAVFLPVYVFVVVPGRFFRRYEHHPRLRGFVTGATAAAAGAIAGAATVIGRQTIDSTTAGVIALAALLLLVQPRLRIPEPLVIVAAGAVGVLLH
jgi:chromate transporter